MTVCNSHLRHVLDHENLGRAKPSVPSGHGRHCFRVAQGSTWPLVRCAEAPSPPAKKSAGLKTILGLQFRQQSEIYRYARPPHEGMICEC